MIKNKFEVIITGVSADGLNRSFLGRRIDYKFLEDIKKLKIHWGFEGGEAETFVLDCPIFNKKMVIKDAQILMENERTGIYKIKKISLIKKT